MRGFLRNQSGASAAEYALIVAIVGVAIGGAAMVLGNNVSYAEKSAAQNLNALNDAPEDAGG